jgi:ribosomal-protein-alanine N-acetyltransferase
MSGPSVRTALRPMTAADVPAVMEIERALFPDDAWSEHMVREELTGVPETRYYLVAAASGEEVAGYAGLAVIGDQGDVMTIAVRDTQQGHGVGRALLAELIAESARRGAADLFLEVRHDNARAKQLYHGMGFVEIGVRRGYYNGADAITMRRALTGADTSAVRGDDR